MSDYFVDGESGGMNVFDKLAALSTDMELLLSHISMKTPHEAQFQIKTVREEAAKSSSPEIDYALTLFCLLNDEVQCLKEQRYESHTSNSDSQSHFLKNCIYCIKYAYESPTEPIQYVNIWRCGIYWLRLIQIILITICLILINTSKLTSFSVLQSQQLEVSHVCNMLDIYI